MVFLHCSLTNIFSKKNKNEENYKSEVGDFKKRLNSCSGSVKQASAKGIIKKRNNSPRPLDLLEKKSNRVIKNQTQVVQTHPLEQQQLDDTNTRLVSGALGMVEAVTTTTSKIASVLRGKNSSSAVVLGSTPSAVVTTKNILNNSAKTLGKTRKTSNNSSPKWVETFDPRREPDMKFNDKVLAWLENNPLSAEEAIKQGITQKPPFPAHAFDSFSDYSDTSEGKEQRMLKKSTRTAIEKYRKEPSKHFHTTMPNSSNYFKGESPSHGIPQNTSNNSNVKNINSFLSRLKNMHYHTRQGYPYIHYKRHDYTNSIDNSNDYLNYSSNNFNTAGNINSKSSRKETTDSSIPPRDPALPRTPTATAIPYTQMNQNPELFQEYRPYQYDSPSSLFRPSQFNNGYNQQPIAAHNQAIPVQRYNQSNYKRSTENFTRRFVPWSTTSKPTPSNLLQK